MEGKEFKITVRGPFSVYVWVGTDIVASIEGANKEALEAQLRVALLRLRETYEVAERLGQVKEI